jgi:hypothetical protein
MAKTKIYLAFSVAVLAVALGSALLVHAQEKVAPVLPTTSSTKTLRPQAIEKKLSGTYTGGRKLCSAIWPGHFRDTLQMPDASKQAACVAWMNLTAGTAYQQGCIFGDGSISMGAAGGGIPTPNCGW